MYPFQTAYLSGPETRICILLSDLDRKHSTVSKMVKILSVSIAVLILQAKTWGKSEEKAVFPESSLFHWMPCLHLKGYQQDSFSYGFLKVWTVFRHSFRLLFGKMSEKDHTASLYGWVTAAFCMHNSLEHPFSLSLWRSYIPGWYIIDYIL